MRGVALLLGLSIGFSAGSAQTPFGGQTARPADSATDTAVPRDAKSALKFRYDRLTDTTTASAPTIHYYDQNFLRSITDQQKPSLDVTAEAFFAGQVRNDTIGTVYLTFRITTTRLDAHSAARQDAKVPETSPVRFLLDDTARFSFDAHLVDSDVRFNWLGTGSNRAEQLYAAEVSPDVIDRIASAQKMEGMIYNSSFKFGRKDILKLTSIRKLFGSAQ